MHNIIYIGIILCFFGCTLNEHINENNPKNQSNTNTNTKKTINLHYSFGYLIGIELLNKGIDTSEFDFEELTKGIKDAMSKEATHVSLEEYNSYIKTEFAKYQQRLLLKNNEEGDKFLKKNAKRVGVKTTLSGLQYEIIKNGIGAKPTLQDKVSIQYKGKLINGTIFDSSFERNAPILFPLEGLIKGLQEGVQLMSVGSTYIFYVPSQLGYGDVMAGRVPIGSALIFEIELVNINN